MKNDLQIVFTKLLLTVGAVGLGMDILKDLEIIFSVLLKFVSIISFVVVIVINWPKFVKTIKTYTKKSVKTSKRNNN